MCNIHIYLDDKTSFRKVGYSGLCNVLQIFMIINNSLDTIDKNLFGYRDILYRLLVIYQLCQCFEINLAFNILYRTVNFFPESHKCLRSRRRHYCGKTWTDVTKFQAPKNSGTE